MEAIVPSMSRLEGRSSQKIRLRSRYGINVLAISRRGRPFKGRLHQTNLQAGDVVLLILNNTEAFADIGITQKTIYIKVLGYDDYGLWAELPKFKIPKLKTERLKL